MEGLCGFYEPEFESMKELDETIKYAYGRFERNSKLKVLKEQTIADGLNEKYIDCDDTGCSFCKVKRHYKTVSVYSQNEFAFTELLADLEEIKARLVFTPSGFNIIKFPVINAEIHSNFYKITVPHELLNEIVCHGLYLSAQALEEYKDNYGDLVEIG